LRLREKFPSAHIAIFTHEKLREIWLHHPAVNEVISFGGNEGFFSVIKKLRAEKFDIALVLPNSPRSALEVWASGIRQRIGYARPWRNFFLTHAIPTRPGHVAMHKRSAEEVKRLIAQPAQSPKPKTQNYSAHQIYEYLYLVGALGAKTELLPPRLFVTADEIEAARKKLGLAGITKPIYGLNPGAEYGPAKRWPVEQFIAAAKEIQQRTNCVWLIFGGKGDLALANLIQTAMGESSGILNLAGKTSLRELMSLLSQCRVLLTNDTGPMHVAAALGTPVIVPFGSTSPELTGPGLPGDARHRLLQSEVPCAPCFLRECPIDFRCMKSITAERVVEAVGELQS
jgi:heptosyltransferase-2